MITINHLPLEIITEIVSYLPRKDRLACSQVSSLWNRAVDCRQLWKFMLVYLDSDLAGRYASRSQRWYVNVQASDPTTAIITKMYHKHLLTIELCWSSFPVPARGILHDFRQYCKKACEYLTLLLNLCVQLRSIKISTWSDVPCLKKVTYHLCKFLRSQLHLVEVSFFNVDFCVVESARLMACLRSFTDVSRLEIIHCDHPNPLPHWRSSFDSLKCLQVLKVDYALLNGGLMDSLLRQKVASLKCIEMIVGEMDDLRRCIPEESWRDLCEQCPMMRVGLHIKNRCSDLGELLCEAIPLTVFTLTCGKASDQTRGGHLQNILSSMIRIYHRTLEKVYVQLNNNTETVDETLTAIVTRCSRLKFFEFHGNVGSVETLRKICEIQAGMEEKSFKRFSIVAKNMNFYSHRLFQTLHRDFGRKFRDADIQFRTSGCSNKNLVYIYY
ncbi:uncharacterized protein LOC116179955 isoform X2 [Photinus pyralis]|uniref:uncharacterized protein LOC116179955 isoform X2 n=1 Tax=Photinus pyralis TaxID=7054 RepID=UPI00126777FE|nr:uncharacterized protein LOC116179955 isoform X2 [Photinus pyralis]